MSQKIRVIVADDSEFVRNLIASYLESADDMEVVACAHDGQHAVELVAEFQPDVVTLDVEMPRMSGLEALEQIMCSIPTPTVMVSGVSSSAADTTLKAIRTGAVDFILKYVPGAKIDPAEMRLDVISKVRSAAHVKVVRTIASRLPEVDPNEIPLYAGGAIHLEATDDAKDVRQAQANSPARLKPAPRPVLSAKRPSNAGQSNKVRTDRDVVVIGASTGGPIAIRELLGRLPADFPAPIIIVQHIPEAFTSVLAAQIDTATPMETKIAESGESLQPRTVYIAPGNRHLLFSSGLKLEIHDGPEICGHRPSIDIMMKSLAQSYPNRVYGVLLTGMGEDGATGLQYIRARGGQTFVQSPETCVVNGMPQRAIELGAADFIGSPEAIADRLYVDIYNRQLDRDAVHSPSPTLVKTLN